MKHHEDAEAALKAAEKLDTAGVSIPDLIAEAVKQEEEDE